MRTVELIEKKRDGTPLTDDELSYLIAGYAKDVSPTIRWPRS